MEPGNEFRHDGNVEATRCLGCMEADQGAPVCPYCGWQRYAAATSVLHLPPGCLLDRGYLVGRVLGQGGFGITYLGWDVQLHRKVAIKEYFPQVIASRIPGGATVSTTSARTQDDFQYGLHGFLNEGRILARFSEHPCIVSVLNLFEANQTGYLVMGYLEGMTLSQSLEKSGGRMAYDVARDILMRVMDGLREVHAQGLLHRDISPDNIYLTRQGLIKILDFGAARFEVGERSQSLSVVLKEGYAPEEQYRRSGHQGPWTDVYGVAATLYRCITGIVPAPSLDRLHADALLSPRQLGVAMPPAAEGALLRALAVRAGERFQSVEAFQGAVSGSVYVPPPPPIPPPGPQPWPPMPGPAPGPPPPPPPLPPPYRLFDTGAVGLATLLGTPLAGTVLMAVNYRRLQKGSAAAWAVIIGVVLLALAGLFGYLVPQAAATSVAVGLVFGVTAAAKSLQGEAVEDHVRRGGRLGSRWSAAGVGLGFLAAIGGAVAGAVFGTSLMAESKVAIGTNDEVFYNGSATKENAEALGAALKTAGYFTDRGATAILAKDPGGTVITFVVKENAWDDADMVASFEDIGRQVAPSVGGFPIEVRLANKAREVHKKLTVGKVTIGTKDEVYYYGSATETEAKAAGETLRDEQFLRDTGATVFLMKGDQGTVLTLVLKDGYWENQAFVDVYEGLARKVAPSVGGLPLQLDLANTSLEVKKIVSVK